MLKITEAQENELTTVTVLASRPLARPGATALALVTKELGTIAFEVDLPAIAAIREALDLAENLLRALPGNSPDRPS